MFTVTHCGLSKNFNSIYAAMRYAIKHWKANATIWTPDRPMWSACQWTEKVQRIQAKKMQGWVKD